MLIDYSSSSSSDEDEKEENKEEDWAVCFHWNRRCYPEVGIYGFSSIVVNLINGVKGISMEFYDKHKISFVIKRVQEFFQWTSIKVAYDVYDMNVEHWITSNFLYWKPNHHTSILGEWLCGKQFNVIYESCKKCFHCNILGFFFINHQ